MHQLQHLSGSIGHSRLNRRLHALRERMAHMPELLTDMLGTSTIYIFDSMSIPACRRARAKRCAKVAGAEYDGMCYANINAILARYFILSVILQVSLNGCSCALLARTTPPRLMIWHVRCRLVRCCAAIVANE